MNVITIKFLTSYVLMPLLAVIFGFIAYLIAKKNRLLSNKKLIFYVLITALILCLPALFGFIDYWFMPYIYLCLQITYLILGWYNTKFLRHFIPDLDEKPYMLEFFINFLITFISAAFFSMIFNLCNELQYGLWACTCLLSFILPSLFKKTYEKYLEIPAEIYKVLKYKESEELSALEFLDYNKLMVLELELFKNVNDPTPSKIKAKAPDNMTFGLWFRKFLSDYNKKFPLNPIEVRDHDDYFGWIFYVKRSFFHPRKYIDYELSMAENKIKEKYTIVVKRVSENVETDETKNSREQEL